MLKGNWTHKTVRTSEDFNTFRSEFLQDKDTIIAGAFDTETTGLNIVHDHMFLFQFGWITKDMQGRTYAVDTEFDPELAEKFIVQANAFATCFPIYLGHNVKFDLHMLHNFHHPYNYPNLSDTQLWIRLSSAAVPERKGGPPLGLKNFSKSYLSAEAKNMESKLKEERTKIASEYNEKLKRYLGWRKKDIDEFFKDKVHDADDLPPNKRDAYYHWYDGLPEWLRSKVHGAVDSDDIQYNYLNRDNVIYYAHLDIVWTIETYLRTRQVVENHGNMEAMKLENQLILPLVEMERTGMYVNRNYLLESRKRMKEYILQKREDLYQLAGEQLKCSQSVRIKELCKERFGREIETTAAEEVTLIIQDIKRENPEDPIIEFLETIQELRTLEKWYATYLLRFLTATKESPILYTSMNQAGTVSGRFTSDLQQFPKKGIIATDGTELFNPRRAVEVPPGYECLVYIDESGLELRTQAIYTILVGDGDLNLCRAYFPFKCHEKDGEWYLDESPDVKWTPTDVHGAMTKIAFDVDETHPDFHDLRYKGKRVNFCKQYGGGIQQIRRMFPEYDEAQIRKIDDAYYKAFPGVKKYQQWVIQQARENAYIENLEGLKYWGADGHHLINMLVQGSGAMFMKGVLLKQWQFIKEHKLKSKLVLQIHDEIVVQIAPGEEWIVWELRKIQENWEGSPVPMVADVEATKTTWYNKQEFKTEEEFLDWVRR